MKVNKGRIIVTALAIMLVSLFGLNFISGPASRVYAAESDDKDYEEYGGVRFYDVDEIVIKDTNQPSEDEIEEASFRTGSGSITGRDWYSYSSKYFYQSLNANQKMMYKAMYEYCMYYLVTEDSSKDSPANYQMYTFQVGNKTVLESLTKEFKVADYGVSFEEADNTIMVFFYENPQFYFLDVYYYRTSAGYYLTFYDLFRDSTARAVYTNMIFDKVDECAQKVKDESIEYNKVKIAHDFVCDNNKYSFSEDLGYIEDYDQSIYSSIIMGKTVCAGYSKCTMAILRKAGQKAICIVSTQKGFHAWNMVMVGANWYNLDVTWDDSKRDNPNNTNYNYPYDYYFLISDDDLNNYDNNPEAHLALPILTNSLFKPVCKTNYSDSTYMDAKNSTALTETDVRADFNGIYRPEVIPVVTLSAKSFTYTGSVIKPAITVKAGGHVVSADSYVVSYPSAKNVGTYKVTVTLLESSGYSGTGIGEFKINPKKTSISKLSSGSKKKISVKVKKISKQASGYQIQYSTKKNFKSKKTVWLKGYNKNSKTISGLKSKKKYYVRVRTYKTVNGTKYYSEWSNVKTVKVK